MRNTSLGEGTSPVRSTAMSKISIVVQNTAEPVCQVVGIAHILNKMENLTPIHKLKVNTKT